MWHGHCDLTTGLAVQVSIDRNWSAQYPPSSSIPATQPESVLLQQQPPERCWKRTLPTSMRRTQRRRPFVHHHQTPYRTLRSRHQRVSPWMIKPTAPLLILLGLGSRTIQAPRNVAQNLLSPRSPLLPQALRSLSVQCGTVQETRCRTDHKTRSRLPLLSRHEHIQSSPLHTPSPCLRLSGRTSVHVRTLTRRVIHLRSPRRLNDVSGRTCGLHQGDVLHVIPLFEHTCSTNVLHICVCYIHVFAIYVFATYMCLLHMHFLR
jgi:hypothetical protein